MAVSVLASALVAPATARSQVAQVAQVPGEEIARRTFEEGAALEKEGDYAGALAKFRESEQIKATLGNRYHKAYCLEMIGKLAAALTEYETVEKSARDAGKNDLALAARQRVEPLWSKVPQLSVRLGPPSTSDAVASLDGGALASALLDGKAFRIDPGEHVLTATAPSFQSFTRRFTASEGTVSSIEIVLEATPPPPSPVVRASRDAPPATVAQPAARAAPPRKSRALPIATTAGALLLAGGGVAAFLVAGQKQEDLRRQCSSSPNCTDAKGPTRTFDALALGAWVGAAGLAALSIVLWSSSPSSTTAQTRVTARSSSLALEGRF